MSIKIQSALIEPDELVTGARYTVSVAVAQVLDPQITWLDNTGAQLLDGTGANLMVKNSDINAVNYQSRHNGMEIDDALPNWLYKEVQP